MGRLVEGTHRTIELASRHCIGRDPWSDLVLPDAGVSGAHCRLSWTPSGWTVRDLGSRNGTRVDGHAIPVGRPVPLVEGSRLGIGRFAFVVADAGPPQPMVVGEQGAVLLESPVHLPASETFLVRDASGGWWMDDGHGQRRLTDRMVFEAGGQRWTAYLDGVQEPTREDRLESTLPVLVFRVSRDEEHVDLHVERTDGGIEVPSRAHHYTLVTLARQRLADRNGGIDDRDAGWLETPELCKRLRLQRGAVYTHLYRARRQLVTLGLPDLAERLVEHRTEASQLRLGLPRVEVTHA